MFTVITYRPNKLVTCLGTVQETHDSSLAINSFRTEEELESFLVHEHLTDLRRNSVDQWSSMNEYRFLYDGEDVGIWGYRKTLALLLESAKSSAQSLFNDETRVKREKEEAEQLARAEREAIAKRARDMSDLARIVATYPVQELRDSLKEFKL